MAEQWTLAEGFQKLSVLTSEGEPEIEDLAVQNRQIAFTVSLMVLDDVDEIDGVKIKPQPGISVILQSEGDSEYMFEKTFVPADGETLLGLMQHIARALGVDPDERIWEDGQGN